MEERTTERGDEWKDGSDCPFAFAVPIRGGPGARRPPVMIGDLSSRRPFAHAAMIPATGMLATLCQATSPGALRCHMAIGSFPFFPVARQWQWPRVRPAPLAGPELTARAARRRLFYCWMLRVAWLPTEVT